MRFYRTVSYSARIFVILCLHDHFSICEKVFNSCIHIYISLTLLYAATAQRGDEKTHGKRYKYTMDVIGIEQE